MTHLASSHVLPASHHNPEYDACPTTTQPPPPTVVPNITIHISNPSSQQSVSSHSLSDALTPIPSMLSTCANFPSNPDPQVSAPKYQGQLMTPVQHARWDTLLTKFGEARVHKHQWEWIHGDFLPLYVYQSVDRLTDYWTEWAEGIGGFLSTREMTETWGPKWRRNNGGQRTECGRRKRVIDLVTTLAARPNWDVKKALRFLSEKYEDLYSPRKFCDWLKPDNVQAVLVAAVSSC